MAIDAYPVIIEQKTYTRQNLFFHNTQDTYKSSIGVNIYQDFAYTQLNSASYLAMTTGATVVMNQWAEFGIFCSYMVPKAELITTDSVSQPTMGLGNYVYCGNTLGFIPWAEKIFHPKFAVDVGIGGATTQQLTNCDASGCTGDAKQISYPIFIIKPAILLEANLFSFLQWTLGVRYRFQLSSNSANDTSTLNSKASWFEFSTGPVFNVR